jgi:hypothetical protein
VSAIKHYLTAQIDTYFMLKNKQPESHIFHCWCLVYKPGKVRYIAKRDIFRVRTRNGVCDAEIYRVHETWSVRN